MVLVSIDFFGQYDDDKNCVNDNDDHGVGGILMKLVM